MRRKREICAVRRGEREGEGDVMRKRVEQKFCWLITPNRSVFSAQIPF